jgi:formate dehydrogenase iron-sulfur subunit
VVRSSGGGLSIDGQRALAAHARSRLGLDFHQTSSNGSVTLEPVYCLGNCACSPALTIDGQVHGRVTPERFDRLVMALEQPHECHGLRAARLERAFRRCREVARAIARTGCSARDDITLVRSGSRGLFWLEPLVEVATPAGRIAYGPVAPEDVPGLFEAGFVRGGAHALLRGPTEQIAYLKKQERLTFARVGITDPLSLTDYAAHGGWRGLRNAIDQKGADIVETLIQSGLRGRGGAAFPAGIKWRTVLGAQAGQKYVVCNADEGDSGTFSDRMIMEGDPFVLIEGMAIAGVAVGATRGYLYLRSEYPDAERTFEAAIALAREAGFLGEGILAAPHSSSSSAGRGSIHLRRRKPRCWRARGQARHGPLRRRCPQSRACSASRR